MVVKSGPIYLWLSYGCIYFISLAAGLKVTDRICYIGYWHAESSNLPSFPTPIDCSPKIPPISSQLYHSLYTKNTFFNSYKPVKSPLLGLYGIYCTKPPLLRLYGIIGNIYHAALEGVCFNYNMTLYKLHIHTHTPTHPHTHTHTHTETGSGKTFTMGDDSGEGCAIIPRAMEYIFDFQESLKEQAPI